MAEVTDFNTKAPSRTGKSKLGAFECEMEPHSERAEHEEKGNMAKTPPSATIPGAHRLRLLS
jgi:hypothetical protein